MDINEIVQKSISKRPLMREKLREKRKNEIYDLIPVIEKLISNRDALGRDILKKTILNLDFSSEKMEFNKLEEKIVNLLKEKNIPENYLAFNYICDKCKDTGYYDGKICSCVLNESLGDRILESGITSVSRNKNFQNFNMDLFTGTFESDKIIIDSREYIKKLCNFSKNYCENIGKLNYGVFFFGRAGAGKTYLSTAMVNYALDLGNRALFITAGNLFDLMYTYTYSFYRDKKELQEKINQIKNVDFLVLDDLGSEVQTKQNNSFLSSILDSRIENNLATVITSNHTEYDLADIYDSRISSRIRGYFEFLPFPEDDLRLRNKR